MSSTAWLFDVLVSLWAASLLVLLVASAAVFAIGEPARRIRAIQLAICGLAVLPLLSLIPGYPRWSVADAVARRPTEGEIAREAPSAMAKRPAETGRQAPATTRPGVAATRAAASPARGFARVGHYRPWVIGVYLFGALAMAAWSALGWIAVRRVLRASSPAGAQARNVLHGVAGAASDRVRLVTSPLVSQPCAVGWRCTTIILPHDYDSEVDSRQFRWALAHEWSHVVRGDLRCWTASGLLGWFYFCQPLYWLLRRQLHVCQDFLADAAAACRAEAAEDYAEFLILSAVRAREPTLAAGLGFGGRMSDLHRRIAMLVGRPLPLESSSPRWWNFAAVAFAVLLVAIAAMLVLGPIRSVAAQNKSDAAKTEGAKKSEPNRLSYNDGTGEAKRSIGGSGEMISFALPREDAKVAGIRIHGSRYGLPQAPKEDFMIYFLNADMTETVATKTAPYARFKRGDQQWVEIRFPKPIEVPKEFWVCLDFRAAQTKGVYVSVDDSTDGSHSKVGLPGMETKEANVGGDWMVEVVLAK